MRRMAWAGMMTLAMVAGCDGDATGPEPTQAVSSVVVSPADADMTVGQSREYAVTVQAADGSVLTGRAVAWSSSDGTVAEVSAEGLVSAHAAGSARIRATVEGKVGEAQLQVAAGAVDRVELEPGSLTFEEGDEVHLVATPVNAAGQPIGGLAIHWTSSDPDVATVGATGVVTGVRVGTATVTAAVHDREVSAAVTVRASYAFDLVYTTTSEYMTEIFALDIRETGGTPSRLFPSGTWAAKPAPSPDGTRIAYTCWSGFGSSALCVADRDGGNQKVVSWHMVEQHVSPTWDPSGTRLAYVRTYTDDGSNEVRSRIAVVGVDGSSPLTLTEEMVGDQLDPAWSPGLAGGEERIALSSGTGSQRTLWTMRPDGSDRRQITSGGEGLDFRPSWSPDGGTIAFQRIGLPGQRQLRLVEADGSDERPLGPSLRGSQAAPAWSPDGRLIAFASTHESYAAETPTYQLYTVWADGSKLARRSSGDLDKAAPAWLPRR